MSKETMMKKSYTFYAVATKQPDSGAWYPWVDTMACTREEAVKNYGKKYNASRLGKDPDVQVKRFYVSTTPGGAR
jgi:hypothetical protein